LEERWKRNPFREDQLTRRTVGDVEYIDVQLDDGRKVTLKKDADGNWKVERWSGGAPTMMNEEVLGRGNFQFTLKSEFTQVTYRGNTYSQPNTTRINLSNGRTDFTPKRKSTGQPVSAGWQHIINDHFNRPPSANRSVFTIDENRLKEIIQSKKIVNSTVIEIEPGIYCRTVDTGEIIGVTTLREGGLETTWIQVYTDVMGNIITTYPISPKIR
jgi:hypothetical protein